MRRPIKEHMWALATRDLDGNRRLAGSWTGDGPELFHAREEAREFRGKDETVIKVAIVEVERHGGGR